ncbi:hypothetical protein EV356DRAFT_580647 [Viridothelium virens]|uniref:Uncharacterized protein n=1 Tax=Viridothelium virens TaxID=1048519 RepID=A0A6A6GVB8_VIRVR|nr:hypothetical protein EV356DRAFT_580647 [Viridothelium virens]
MESLSRPWCTSAGLHNRRGTTCLVIRCRLDHSALWMYLRMLLMLYWNCQATATRLLCACSTQAGATVVLKRLARETGDGRCSRAWASIARSRRALVSASLAPQAANAIRPSYPSRPTHPPRLLTYFILAVCPCITIGILSARCPVRHSLHCTLGCTGRSVSV